MSSDLIYLIITAIAVSIDSFFVGFGLSLKRSDKFVLPICVALATFLLCFSSYLLIGKCNVQADSDLMKKVGCIILAIIGFYNLFKKDSNDKPSVFQSVVAGFAVGFDACIANASLILMGYDSVAIPVLLTATHLLTVILGICLAKVKFFAKTENGNLFSGIILLVLALVKLLT